MNKDELISKVRELKELRQMADELAAEIESLSDEIKSVMVAENKTEMIVDCFKVRYTSVTTTALTPPQSSANAPKLRSGTPK
ncbi:MAG: hypothetical protein HDT42_03005 [Ruminococcaceae bacterium]|nr:hypothetical protein [Oscillospiraceae bacterium]